MITKLKAPPLIVTLGTFSLFRGIAEGLTRGHRKLFGFFAVVSVSRPGLCFGVIPTQLFIFVPAVIAVWWWLHRTAFGRSFYAIGFSQEGVAIRGDQGPAATKFYLLPVGLAASLAAVIYVAHLGQAKSDAGTGYELTAIAAVVLGGASIFGGRGTVLGRCSGLFAIVILQNGLAVERAADGTGGHSDRRIAGRDDLDRPRFRATASAASRQSHFRGGI